MSNAHARASQEQPRTRRGVVHGKRSPVFIVGFGRSGTTIVTQMVKKYLGVAFGTESQFFVRFHRRLETYGDLREEAHRRRLIEDIARERFFERTRRNFGFVLDVERAVRRVSDGRYASILDEIFSQMAEQDGAERWGDKTPAYIEHLDVLLGLFPAAQFIHVVRDGRDVALSSMSTHFGGKNAYKSAVDWARGAAAVERFKTLVPPAQFCELRYEDLMASPAATFAPLVAFLGIEDHTGDVRASVEKQLPGELRTGNAYKWRTAMSRDEVEVFESVAGAQLSVHGYERWFPQAQPPGPLASAYWLVDHKLRQYARADYWQDNWYQLRVRLGGVGRRSA